MAEIVAQVYDRNIQPDLLAHGAGGATGHQWERELALRLLDELRTGLGCEPSFAAHVGAVSICARNRWELALELLSKCRAAGRVDNPDAATLAEVFGTFAKSSQWRLALDVAHAERERMSRIREAQRTDNSQLSARGASLGLRFAVVGRHVGKWFRAWRCPMCERG